MGDFKRQTFDFVSAHSSAYRAHVQRFCLITDYGLNSIFQHPFLPQLQHKRPIIYQALRKGRKTKGQRNLLVSQDYMLL